MEAIVRTAEGTDPNYQMDSKYALIITSRIVSSSSDLIKQTIHDLRENENVSQ